MTDITYMMLDYGWDQMHPEPDPAFGEPQDQWEEHWKERQREIGEYENPMDNYWINIDKDEAQ